MKQEEKYTETNQSFHSDNGGEKSGFSQMISKPEINFWVPIVTTAVLIAFSFANIKGSIALQNQKLDTLIAQQTTIIQKYEAVQARLGTVEKELAVINSKQ